MSIEDEAINLSKAVLKLENNGYMCEHLRRIAIHHARKIQTLAQQQEKAKA